MFKRVFSGFIFLFSISIHAQNPVEQFYEAYNQKNWKKFESLLHKDFKCIVDSGVTPASRKQFYENMYNSGDIWFSEWKILEMTETSTGCFLIRGTFSNEFDLYLYGAPVEGLWTYCTKDKKIISIDWHDFPENPNQAKGDKKEKEFNDWIILNYPDYAGITPYWGHDWAEFYRDIFRKYRKSKGD